MPTQQHQDRNGDHLLDYIGGSYPYECVRCHLRFCVEDIAEMHERAMRETDARDAIDGVEPDLALYQWENAAELRGELTARQRRTCGNCGYWANHVHPLYNPNGPRCTRCHGCGYDPDEQVPQGCAPEEACHRCGGQGMEIRWTICTVVMLSRTRPPDVAA